MLRQERQRKNRLTRRRKRVRKKIFGTPERPRLCVYRSLRQIYAQLVDDQGGRTLTGISSLAAEVRSQIKPEDSKSSVSKKVGLRLAQKAKEKGISRVVFDRNRYPYHGRVKSLAEGVREGGLGF
ncbi:MAG: 50S ribosomal protein L18 [Candidatus Zixiibacteriota bacterium]|jgi:large subunit ribosomal protein L18